MSLSKTQQSLIDDLNLIPDPHERLSAVVSQATNKILPEADKTDENRVSGCISKVWLTGQCDDGRCVFLCDAESPMVKGLVAMLCRLYTGATPEEVLSVEPDVLGQCGFDRLLSPTRLNGLNAVRAKIRELASRMVSSHPFGP